MNYDEQAMRQVVEDRVRWAVEFAARGTVDEKVIATLAAEMLRQLPAYWPEEGPSKS